MELGQRRRQILTAIVHDYIKTAEPVGSETLAQRHNFGIKPATIRNEMAAMAEMGYLKQPHTSAGRVPSDLGYRYYVDELMPRPKLWPGLTLQVAKGYEKCETEIESILHQTCRILSNLTHYASLATAPQMGTITIRHIALSAVSPKKILVVAVLNTGHISHRIIDAETSVSPTELIALGNIINSRLEGVDFNNLASRSLEPLPPELIHLTALYQRVVGIIEQELSGAVEEEVYVDGTSHILKQPEFAKTDKASGILSILEKRRLLFQTLSRALLGNDVTVIIGSENQFQEMHECSFVASKYHIGGRVCGSIGVMGPTRMDYRRAVAAVRFMAANLSKLLTSLTT
jgi:heat-inducible transcriptional repressor